MQITKYCCCIVWLALLVSEPGKAAEQVSVTVSGVKDAVLENIMSSLSLQKQKDHPRLSASRVRTLHEKAEGEIKLAMQALGYYKPVISSTLSKTDTGWQAQYAIDAGPRIKIAVSDIRIIGAGSADSEFTDLRNALPLQAGAYLNHGRYEKAKKDLQRLAATRGYFSAEFRESTVEVDLNAYSAAVHLHFYTGERYRFGLIRFSDSPIRQDKLEQYLPFQTGDPYESALLFDLQRRLNDTDYFEEIIVSPQRDEASGLEVPIQVALTPRKRNRYTAGLGFGTDTGPRLKLGWDNRYINQRGHRAGVDTRISPVLSTLSSYYTLPHFRKKDAELGFNASLNREDTDTSKSNSINFGSNYRHRRWGWDESISLNFLYENFEIGNREETSKILFPGIGWTKTEADDPTYTLNGYRLGFNLRGAVESFLSDVSFVQANLNGKFIRSFWENGRIIVRGNLGLTEVNDFDRMPGSLRYFAGGDNSIRGFDYEDLGPRNAEGLVVGGKYLAVASVEYEHRIREKWSLASFIDAGNAFNKFGGEIEYGAGFGVRWLSPVGLVRVDLAMGVSDPDKPLRLHIVIGPDL